MSPVSPYNVLDNKGLDLPNARNGGEPVSKTKDNRDKVFRFGHVCDSLDSVWERDLWGDILDTCLY